MTGAQWVYIVLLVIIFATQMWWPTSEHPVSTALHSNYLLAYLVTRN